MGTARDVPSRDTLRYCVEHTGEELKRYCETCEELVCLQCVVEDGKHQFHNHVWLNKAFEIHREEIVLSLEPIESRAAIFNRSLAHLDARFREIGENQVTLEGNVRGTFRQLRDALNRREAELLGKLNSLTEGKMKALAAQRDQIETTLAQLNSCIYYIRESLKADNECFMLRMRTNIVRQVKELTNLFEPDVRINTQADIVFTASSRLASVCQKYGQLFIPGMVEPSECYATGEGLKAAAVGEKSTIILHAINFEGKLCEEPMKSLECELVSELNDTKVFGSAVRRGLNQYEIMYQPTVKGRHKLHILAEGKHVMWSPFSVAVTSSVEKICDPILTIRKPEKPWGVAINQKGELVVTESCRYCVSVFTPSGRRVLSFGSHGCGVGQFLDPWGVTVDGEGNIFVADKGNHRVQKFTSEGKFLAAAGTKGRGPLQFLSPTDVAFNAGDRKLYVADRDNGRIQVLNSDLSFSSCFGKPGAVRGQFNYAMGVACDSTGKVFVADCANHRIQVFTAEGRCLNVFSRCGLDELRYPIGVAVDRNGRVYVTEGCSKRRVCVFTVEGQFVMTFGGHWVDANGLAVDSHGLVFVCANNGVEVY